MMNMLRKNIKFILQVQVKFYYFPLISTSSSTLFIVFIPSLGMVSTLFIVFIPGLGMVCQL